ncbi:LysR family transcriptional regulator [Bdellovibrio sp. NC01]|uniref:LysR family transcriptional regulator n=1 Tax=Bdellovibrio sp. NC01 TaxID=2220073 RepID=UPI00115B8A07|nr:LysR family transcriptional regulator [Bdellovibrio sp. NC01]QDK37763.1 hypothetical protein DOE51_09295 [Bdellovibrio sp. NC01]
METERLRYFTVIAETGSLTKASQLLGISHSGLSKAISSLEAETSLKLFRPQGRGLEITPEGKWFYQKAQEILKIANEIKMGKVTELGAISLGMSSVVGSTCSGEIAKELKESLRIYELDLGEIEGKILSGDIHFGVAFVPAPRPELEYLELGEVTFATYARKDLYRATPAQELPFAVPLSEYPDNPLGYRNRDGFPLEIPRRAEHFVASFAIGLNLLRSGQAALYMADFVADQENKFVREDLHLVKIKEFKSAETKRKLYLVKRQSAEESKEMKKIAKVLRRICC